MFSVLETVLTAITSKNQQKGNMGRIIHRGIQMRAKGRKVQKEVVVDIHFRARELIVIRVSPFLWIYFNIGKYEGRWKRLAFDFWFELRGQIYGFSWEKAVEVRK